MPEHTKKPDGHPRCYALLIGGSPDVEDETTDLDEAAARFKENGCQVSAASYYVIDDADTNAPATKKGIRGLLATLREQIDGDDDLHVYVNTHGGPSDFTIVGSSGHGYDFFSTAELAKSLVSLSAAKLSFSTASCYGGNWLKYFTKDARTLFVSQGSKGELVYGNDFPLWPDWNAAEDLNGDGHISYYEAFFYARAETSSSTPLYHSGKNYLDTGIVDPGSMASSSDVAELKTIASLEELKKSVKELPSGKYLLAANLPADMKSSAATKRLLEQTALAAHGAYSFAVLEAAHVENSSIPWGGIYVFGKDLPPDGLSLGSAHNFDLQDIDHQIQGAELKPMERALEAKSWVEVESSLVHAPLGKRFDKLSELVALYDTKTGGTIIPDHLIALIAGNTRAFAPSVLAFRRALARPTLINAIEGFMSSSAVPKGMKGEFSRIILENGKNLSARLLVFVVRHAPNKELQVMAYRALKVHPQGKDDYKVVQSEYPDLDHAVLGHIYSRAVSQYSNGMQTSSQLKISGTCLGDDDVTALLGQQIDKMVGSSCNNKTLQINFVGCIGGSFEATASVQCE